MYYQRHGRVPAKRFTALTDAAGHLHYEELISSGGFGGPCSYLYRLRPPTRVLRTEAAKPSLPERWTEGTQRNRRFAVADIQVGPDGPAGRTPLFFNDDLVYSLMAPAGDGSAFYRDGGADELVVVVEGSGVLQSMFGDLSYRALDFVYVPRGTTWRLSPDPGPQTMVVLETVTSCRPPERYRSPTGQLLPRSLYSERDLRTPVLQSPTDAMGEFTISVRVGSTLTTYVMANHPFDTVGWDGALYPYALNMADIEPLSGRVHLMPDMHQVFASEGTVICAITPSRSPDHPHAYPAQADHSADCDEIFYRFGTDDGSPVPGVGAITLHPRAAAHGPKPGFETRPLPARNHLYGLIIDVARPVSMTRAAEEADDPEYLSAWL